MYAKNDFKIIINVCKSHLIRFKRRSIDIRKERYDLQTKNHGDVTQVIYLPHCTFVVFFSRFVVVRKIH